MQFTAPQEPVVSKKNRKSSGIFKSDKSKIRVLLFVVVLLVLSQGVSIYLLLSMGISEGAKGESGEYQQIIERVAELVRVDSKETPSVAKVNNAEALRAENPIQQQVYALAQDGDYVIGFTDQMVIYRQSTDEVVYVGMSPGQILQQAQLEVIKGIELKLKEAGLLPEDSASIQKPEINIIANAELFKSRDPEFYANAQDNDFLVVYNDIGLIAVYRQDTAEVINSGFFKIQIDR